MIGPGVRVLCVNAKSSNYWREGRVTDEPCCGQGNHSVLFDGRPSATVSHESELAEVRGAEAHSGSPEAPGGAFEAEAAEGARAPLTAARMPRCAGCRFWTPTGEARWAQGTCPVLHYGPTDEASGAPLVRTFAQRHVETHAAFGCVLHEPR